MYSSTSHWAHVASYCVQVVHEAGIIGSGQQDGEGCDGRVSAHPQHSLVQLHAQDSIQLQSRPLPPPFTYRIAVMY